MRCILGRLILKQTIIFPTFQGPIRNTLISETTAEESLPTTQIPTTSTSPESCASPFHVSGTGCYLVSHTELPWHSAEQYCQTLGSNIHLAGMETPQVGIYIVLFG